MKLARDKVIARLKSRIKQMEREAVRDDAARATKHKQAVRAFNRVHITNESTYEQIGRALNLLGEVRRYAPDNGYKHNVSYVQTQIKREISLLELSADDFVSVRTNSSLADYLS